MAIARQAKKDRAAGGCRCLRIQDLKGITGAVPRSAQEKRPGEIRTDLPTLSQQTCQYIRGQAGDKFRVEINIGCASGIARGKGCHAPIWHGRRAAQAMTSCQRRRANRLRFVSSLTPRRWSRNRPRSCACRRTGPCSCRRPSCPPAPSSRVQSRHPRFLCRAR